MIIKTKNGQVKIFAKTVEDKALEQITQMSESPLGENAHIRIMPDCHTGVGCVIGTTMRITDKVCPNLVGVDIGCGVDLVHTTIDFSSRFEELDSVIRKQIPSGTNTHAEEKPWDFERLLCWDKLGEDVQARAQTSLGTLGGGNHFIEAYDEGWLSVHSGSRNIGLSVADYYQKLAIKKTQETEYERLKEQLEDIAPKERKEWLKEHPLCLATPRLCYLTGEDMEAYLHDVAVMQEFADANRLAMLNVMVKALGGEITEHIHSVHNYIDTEHRILRKGAIGAEKGQLLVIPLNMRDGLLVCCGKGNADWNNSAPHGAGRLYSRARAKELFTVEEYRAEMAGIFTTCINQSTLDEAPFAYKDYREIMDCIDPTVEILHRLLPIFNFKAN